MTGHKLRAAHLSAPLPEGYWNLAGSFYAYVFNNLSQMPGIQAVGMSSGLGFPNHYYPSVTMIGLENRPAERALLDAETLDRTSQTGEQDASHRSDVR